MYHNFMLMPNNRNSDSPRLTIFWPRNCPFDNMFKATFTNSNFIRSMNGAYLNCKPIDNGFYNEAWNIYIYNNLTY